jgi:hypothetical protein
MFKVSEKQEMKCRIPIARIRLSKYNIFLAPLVLTPHSSVLSTTSDNATDMKSKQQLEKESKIIPEDTGSLNVSSSTTLDEENQSNEMSSFQSEQRFIMSNITHQLIIFVTF